MVAVFVKTISLLSLIGVSYAAAPAIDASVEESAFILSQRQYEASKKVLEAKIEHCTNQKRILPGELFRPLRLPFNELKLALYVLNARAEDACEGGAREKFFYEAARYREVSKHYGRSPGDAADYTAGSLLFRDWERFEFEAKYLRLEKAIRTKLESIPELKKPFSLFGTLDAYRDSNL